MASLESVEIRPATARDKEGILNCLAESFEPYRRHYSAEAYADTTLDGDTLNQRMSKMHVLVAMGGERVVGTIAGVRKGTEGHLRGMAVIPAFAGKGVAARLLSEMEGWLLSEGCSCVTLDTTEPLKAAMRFYEKHGYRRSGRMGEFFGMPLIEYVKVLSASDA